MMKNDYKIVSYYNPRKPNDEKFKVTLVGSSLVTCDTYEAAARLVVKLVKDPWYLERGQTRLDRANA